MNAKDAPTFTEALKYWVRLGFINFGGPAGQIAIMHKEIVEQRKWLSEGEFLRALNFCMMLPGPEAQQLASYIGWKLHGIRGGLVAGLWFILPSVVVLWALSWMVAAYGQVPAVAGLLYGVQPVVVAIVVEAVVRIGRRTLRHWGLILIAGAAFVGIYLLRVPFPAIVFGAAAIGALLGPALPQVFKAGAAGHGRAAPTGVSAVYPPFARSLKLIMLFVMLWLLPVGALIAWQGSASVYAQEALFFTGAAFVTFGGAYAVLSYIADAAVQLYGWLEPEQMIQGLALAESTPGPLIMVTQYVGFLAAWRYAGELPPLLSGTIGALTVTYVTFLPCFMFIFVGAPYIEALAHKERLQTALVGVTAAIVGVILNLGVFFATHVLLPSPGQIDGFALVLTLSALVAILRLHGQIPLVIAAGAVAGVTWTLGRQALGV